MENTMQSGRRCLPYFLSRGRLAVGGLALNLLVPVFQKMHSMPAVDHLYLGTTQGLTTGGEHLNVFTCRPGGPSCPVMGGPLTIVIHILVNGSVSLKKRQDVQHGMVAEMPFQRVV